MHLLRGAHEQAEYGVGITCVLRCAGEDVDESESDSELDYGASDLPESSSSADAAEVRTAGATGTFGRWFGGRLGLRGKG